MPDEPQSNENNSPVYPSLAAKGHVVIEIPYMHHVEDKGMYGRTDMRPYGAKLPGACERIQACELGEHVIREVENDFKYRSPKTASARLMHYSTHAAASVLDAGTAARMKRLAEAMPRSRTPEQYFRAEVVPFLRQLTPRAR